MPRILFIVQEDYGALCAKSVDGMIFERDEGGFFDRVITVHPISHKNQIIEFNDTYVLYELARNTFGDVSRHRFLRMLVAPFHFVRALITIINLVHREKIDIIRALDPFWMGLLGVISAKWTGRPICVSVQAEYGKCYQLTGGAEIYTFFGIQWPAKLACRLVFALSDLIMPNRESIAQWAVQNGARREKIRITPIGIDVKAFEAIEYCDIRARFDIPSDCKILSFVGRLSPENYLVDMLEMARRLAVLRKDFCLVIAGGGKMEEECKNIVAADLNLKSVVRFVGFQPRVVCFSLRKCSAVSLCLMGGNSLIEACLARRPVISYDVDWHKELVQSGKTGFLISEGDVDGLVAAVEECFNEPAKAEMLGAEAHRQVISRHDIKLTSNLKKEAYKELLKKRRM